MSTYDEIENIAALAEDMEGEFLTYYKNREDWVADHTYSPDWDVTITDVCRSHSRYLDSVRKLKEAVEKL